MICRRTFLKATSASALTTLCTRASAQSAWPAKPIRFLVGFAPGGASDLLARLLGNEIGRELGTPVVIENKPGMAGSIAAEATAKSPGDGYTILLGTPGMEIFNPMLYERLPYDAMKDFAPITLIVRIPNLLVVHRSVPVQNVAQLIAYAKQNPGRLNYASNGNGSASHLAVELLKSAAGIDMVHVPYKGSGPAVADLSEGRVHVGMDSFTALYPQVQAGKLHALGVSTLQRVSWYPDIPAIAETLPNLEASSFIYVTSPAGTPPAIVARLNTALHHAVQKPEVQGRLRDLGMTPALGTPQDLHDALAAERTKWRPVIEANRAALAVR
ncbi:MAG: Bug family tripartite tricarboxylate transporter substrate binding protein [Lautropia sp.]